MSKNEMFQEQARSAKISIAVGGSSHARQAHGIINLEWKSRSGDTLMADSLPPCRRYAACLSFPQVPWVCFAAPTAIMLSALRA